MTEIELKERFLRFALNVYRLTQKFPKQSVYFVITDQILRSLSSPGANYCAACRAKSGPDFINKLKLSRKNLMKRSIGSSTQMGLILNGFLKQPP